MRRVCAMAAMAVVLSGCAGHWSRSYGRWEALWRGPYAAWARCIDDRSIAYLTTEPAPGWYKGQANAPQRAMFTWVLADCGGLMHGAGWDELKPAQYERLVGDAFQHFLTVDARIQGEIAESMV